MTILTEREARRIVEAVLGVAKADDVRIDLLSREGGNARFAENGVTTAGETVDVEVRVTAAFGARSGSATTNGVDDEGLTVVTRRAEQAARLAPEDPEYVAPVGPGEYPEPGGWSEATAEFGPAERAGAASAAIREATARDGVVSGFLENGARALGTASSNGLFLYHPETRLEYTNTVRTPDGGGSGWAGVELHDAAELDAAARARVAAEKAFASRDARPLEPGDYPVILEPVAVSVMAGALVGSMDARRAMEGRSFLSAPGGETKRGERLLAPEVTIETDPADPVVPGRPWASEQLPARRTVWVDEGVVATLRYDRWWAQEHDVEPMPASTNLVMSGQDRSLEELIGDTERAVLVTRLWYIRQLNPRDLTLTGLTRDGTFWVEDGEIRHAVNNFRWNESPVRVLSRVEAMSRPVQVADADWAISPALVPAIRASSFHFASVSKAV